MNLRPQINYRVYGIAALACLAMGGGNFHAASFVAYRTYFTYGQYTPPGSLGEHLFEEHVRLTNGATKSPDITLTRSMSGATWNPNWFYFGCSNMTGQSHWRSNSGGSESLFKTTAVSRVLLVTANHIGGGPGWDGAYSNQFYLFVDRTNGNHWRRVVGSYGPTNQAAAGDYRIIALETALPAGIDPMPIVFNTTISNKLANRNSSPYPHANVCQHSRQVSPQQGVYFGDWHGVAGGDSGSPAWIVVSNRCLFVPNLFSAPGINDAAQFLADCAHATTNAGHSTNTYFPQVDSLSQFPDL